MRTAVVFFSATHRERMLNMARALARGIESQGHQVDLIEGDRDVNSKLTIYQYISVGAEPVSTFGGRLPPRVGQFLNSAGMLTGKRSFAFVPKSLFGAGKALRRLMRLMEQEGMLLKTSDVIVSTQEAEEIGRRLHVK